MTPLVAQGILAPGAVVQLTTLQFVLALVVGSVTVLTSVVVAVAWIVRLAGRQQGHEDVCNVRYAQIAANFATVAESFKELKVHTDKQHTENIGRFEHFDQKFEQLMQRLLESRLPR